MNVDLKDVFLLVGTKYSHNLVNLTSEIIMHNDILVLDFVDTYKNLTIKSLSSFYFTQLVYNTTWILKCDDDMFINIYKIITLIKVWFFRQERIMFGHCSSHIPVSRNRKDKYFVSKENYPNKTFPRYCFGTAYILSNKALQIILTSNKNIPLNSIEDASVGILANIEKKVKIIDIKYWRIHDFKGNICPKTYTQHRLTAPQINSIWTVCKQLYENRTIDSYI